MTSLRICATLIPALVILIHSPGLTFPWDQDMRDQPSVKAQEASISTSKNSVPTGGKELFLAPTDTGELGRDRLTAGLYVHNPAPKSPESINRGKAASRNSMTTPSSAPSAGVISSNCKMIG